MKKIYKLKTMLLIALLSLVGVSVNAEEVVFKTLDFSKATKESVSAYNKDWKATVGTNVWSIHGFNNNKAQWDFIKCGSSKFPSIATISTGSAYEKAITKVVVTIDDVEASKVNSIQLQIADNDKFSSPTAISASEIKKGDLTFAISNPTANSFYRLSFDCKRGEGKKNGFVQVSKVTYFYNNASASKQNTTVTFAKNSYEFTNGSSEMAAFTGQKATTTPAGIALKYTSDKEWAVVGNDGTVTLNSKAEGIATITAAFAGDDTYNPSSASYTIKVLRKMDGDGTSAKPYSVADVLYLISVGQTSTNEIYVKGIAKDVEISTKYASANYNLSDEGSSEKLYVFGGKSLGGSKFTKNELVNGDRVVVKGKLKEYNKKWELDRGNELVSLFGHINTKISAVGYSTLYYSDRALVVPENVEAYTYKVVSNKLEQSHLYNAGETIPAGTGVVLKAAKGEYVFALSETAGTVDPDNQLKGSDAAAQTAGGTTYYKLSTNKGGDASSVGFYYGAAGGAAFANGAHKAYLATPAASGVRAFLFNGSSITGIQNATVNNAAEKVYDLQGRRVQNAQKGLYIINGKKVLVK